MKRSIKSIENEIVHQILISELCFDICGSIDTSPRWTDFLPFYYNLNFSKGLNSLHSLLLSDLKNEISIKNYIKDHKKEFPNENIDEFIKDIEKIVNDFSKIFKFPLRHKITAHIDENFFHHDFPNAYILPDLIKDYKEIVKTFKKVYFEFTNYSYYNKLDVIKEQSDKIICSLYI